jgi:hypothetical protein
MNYLRKFIIALSLITLNDGILLYATPPAFSEDIEGIKIQKLSSRTKKLL